jgi:hypothetical protein
LSRINSAKSLAILLSGILMPAIVSDMVRPRRDVQLPHEFNQIVLFLGSEFEFKDQVEELHRVFQCQSPTEIRRAVLDTPQRERLSRSIDLGPMETIADLQEALRQLATLVKYDVARQALAEAHRKILTG